MKIYKVINYKLTDKRFKGEYCSDVDLTSECLNIEALIESGQIERIREGLSIRQQFRMACIS